MKSVRVQGWKGDLQLSHETPRRKAWACVTGGRDRRGEVTVSPWPSKGWPEMAKVPAKIGQEWGASKLEPGLHPVKGGLGVMRSQVPPCLHGSGVVPKS